jgi:hypothetical protein
MAGGGYVKLHREILEHPVFVHPGVFHLWCYCLMRANWKDSKAMVPGTLRQIEVRRGQFITGRESLFANLYANTKQSPPTPRTVWRWLETLEEYGSLRVQTLSGRCSLVTVCNYDTYQSEDSGGCPADVQLASSSRPGDVQVSILPASTVEEVKKGRKERSKPMVVSLADSLKTCEQVHIEISPVWHQWLTYKHERGDKLTETGLRSAVTHLNGKVAAHGSQAVAAAIVKAMASNWQGWDQNGTFDHKANGTTAKPQQKKYLA